MKRVIDYINENKKKKTIIQLLTPIFKHIKGDNVDGTFDVRYKNDGNIEYISYKEGKLEVVAKERGRKKSMNTIL